MPSFGISPHTGARSRRGGRRSRMALQPTRPTEPLANASVTGGGTAVFTADPDEHQLGVSYFYRQSGVARRLLGIVLEKYLRR